MEEASLALPQGSKIVLSGPSGSGKSSFLRLCAALSAPHSGRIFFRGEDVAGLVPRHYRRRVALVAQSATMLPGTVLDNLQTGPRLRGSALSAAELEVLLDRVLLPRPMLGRDAAQLSGGERQRVALGRALANAPDVLLLDEPTSALDRTTAARVLGLLGEVSGLGVLLVTHDPAHAASWGEAQYTLERGRLSAVR